MRRLPVPGGLRPRALVFALMLALGVAPPVAVVADTPADDMARRLAELVRQAPEVQLARREVEASEADVRAAQVARFPRFGVDTVFGNVPTDLGNDRDRRTDLRIVPNAAVTVFDAGRISARIRAAQQGVTASEAVVRRAGETVVLDALTAYLQVLRFTLLSEVGSSSEQALSDIAALEERRVALGGGGLADSRLASSRRALSANRVLQFKLSLEEANARFQALFGFAPGPDTLPVMRVPSEWVSLGFDRSVEAALALNPDLREVAAKLGQARERLEAERAARFPALDLTVSKRYEFPGGNTEKVQFGFRVALGSNTFFESAARIRKAEAELGSQEFRRQALLRDVTQNTTAAWRRSALGDQRELLLQTASQESIAVYRARKRLNSAGRETTLNMLDAQVEANNVIIDWVNSVFDQRQNELRLAKELGKLLPDEGGELDWARAFFGGSDFRDKVRELLRDGLLAPVPSVREAAASNPIPPLAALPPREPPAAPPPRAEAGAAALRPAELAAEPLPADRLPTRVQPPRTPAAGAVTLSGFEASGGRLPPPAPPAALAEPARAPARTGEARRPGPSERVARAAPRLQPWSEGLSLRLGLVESSGMRLQDAEGDRLLAPEEP